MIQVFTELIINRSFLTSTLFSGVVEESPYCDAVEAVDQGLHSEMVFNTQNSAQHTNSNPVQVEDDLYCSAEQAVDQGLHTELVYNYV